MGDLEKIEKKLEILADKINELSIKVETKIVSQDHLKERIEKLERNQTWLVTTLGAALIKLLFDFFQGK